MRIGVFDSGIGGITVLTSLRKRFPRARYVYLGDTANLPYGSKSQTQVIRLSLGCAEKLKKRGVDAVVVACNTASSLALTEIRKFLDPIPVYGVVEPGVQSVLSALRALQAGSAGSGQKPHPPIPVPILILATRATVNSRAYGTALRSILDPASHPVFEQACPLLVPMIEEGWTEHSILRQAIAEYVGDYRRAHSSGIALLGCTHYPWAQESIEAELPGWSVVNSAEAIGKALESQLNPNSESDPETGQTGEAACAEAVKVEWIFTDPQALPEFARKLVLTGIPENT